MDCNFSKSWDYREILRRAEARSLLSVAQNLLTFQKIPMVSEYVEISIPR